MDEHLRWQHQQLLEKAAAALTRNGFGVSIHSDTESVLAELLAQAEGVSRVGFGGSMSLAELGLPSRLEAAGKTTLVHGRPGLSPAQRRDIMQQQLGCELFYTGTNAVTLQGHLVNIDATGNRVGAMTFGPARVTVVAGVNKLVADLESALRRIKQIACPPNARRLGFNTPCAATGVCSDCDSPDRICRVTTILERQPRASRIHVCLVNAQLGY